MSSTHPFYRPILMTPSSFSITNNLCTYDAFSDGFLLLSALENMWNLATLLGHEEFPGLITLLDPTTLSG
ncbi:hypothetical protein BD414DRAFT_551146 [Trametes punicea]|nr:hypothetical protein BD414DRAFT_551146 [Trametes punicea]